MDAAGGNEKKELPLKEVIKISPPSELKNAPNAYPFERERELNLSDAWDKIFKEIDPEDTKEGTKDKDKDTDSRLLKRYFESKWGTEILKNSPEEDFKNLILPNIIPIKGGVDGDPDGSIDAFSPVLSTVSVERGNNNPFKHQPPIAKEANRITEGVVFRIIAGSSLDGPVYRFFRPYSINSTNNVANYFTPSDFKDIPTYLDNFEKLGGVELVFCGKDKDEASEYAKTGFSFVDAIRADAALILRQWKALETEKAIAEALTLSANELLDQIKSNLISPELIQQITDQYRDLMRPSEEIAIKKRQLADAAADLGYKLFLSSGEFKFRREGSGEEYTIPVSEGWLYQKTLKIVHWTTWHTVRRTRRNLFRKKTVTFQVPRHHEQTYVYYRRVEADYDPWREAANAYAADPYNYTVYLFSESINGELVTTDGTSLAEIMENCEKDEQFRKNCVIGFPQYENTIIGRRLLAGYLFFARPMHGMITENDPELDLKENLSYRFTWTGNNLGELAATIPLSPGEEREVAITVSSTRETSRSMTTTSLIEITSIDKRDFETVFEKEVRKETSSTSSGGFKLGASFKKLSGGANFSKKNSARSVSRILNRAVERASREVTTTMKEEMTITTSEKTSLTKTNSVNYSVKNINEGRTLNLMLYRIMNNYESALWLEDFKVIVAAGPSLIAGTDIRLTKVFDKDNLGKLPQWLTDNNLLPVFIEDEKKIKKLHELLLNRICKEILKEYELQENEAPNGDPFLGWEIINQDEKDTGYEVLLKSPVSESELDDQNILLTNCLEKGKIKYPRLDSTTFGFDSGAMYIDAILGDKPAAEDYAEEMRTLEKRYRAAEAGLLESRAFAIKFSNRTDWFSLKEYCTNLTLTSIHEGYIVKLELHPNLLNNDPWELIIDEGNPVPKNDHTPNGIISFKVGEEYAFLKNRDQSEISKRIYLQLEDKSKVLPYRY